MNNLRWGLMTASLSGVLIFVGMAPAQTAQRPDMSPSATQPSATAPDSSSKPMSEEPSMNGTQGAQEQQPAPRADDRTSMGQNSPRGDHDSMSPNGKNDNTWKDVKEFDKFLDKHSDIAQDLRSDPSKVNDTGYVSDHKDLQRWLEKHPQAREEIKENPSAFMRHENRYDKNENQHQ